MGKPVLCLDFEGVIHSHTTPWVSPIVIPNRPVPGAMNFMRDAVNYFEVAIFSRRSIQPGGIEAMQEWIKLWNKGDPRGPIKDLMWPEEKPLYNVVLDDRAVTFRGSWPSIASLLAFKPWYKK